MQVTEINAEGLKHEFTILVPAADIETQVISRLKELSKTVRMPGFRPGKAPVALLRKQYGPSVMGEVLERTVNESTQKALKDRGLQPALQPKIEITSFEDGKDLQYAMTVEVMPEIATIDFASLKLENLVVEPDDEEINKTLDRLAGAHKTSEPLSKKRKSKSGDIVVIDYVGKVDGEEFAGGKGEDYSLELGSNSFIPGFEDQLVGVDADAGVEVKVSFPKEYGAEILAGKDAVFDVILKEIRTSVPAKIDDELAKKVGVDTLEDLKKGIRDEHQREYGTASRQRLKRVLLDALALKIDFEAPQGLIDNEFESIWKAFEEQRKNNPESVTPEEAEMSDEEHREELREISGRRVCLGLQLAEIGHANNIEVSQEDLNKAMAEESRRYPGQEQAILDYFRKTPEAVERLSGPIFEDKVVDFILELATVTDKTVTIEELLKEPEPLVSAKGKKAKSKPKTKPKAKSKAKSKAKTGTAAKKTATKGK